MTSKIVVNNIESDSGVSSVTFTSDIELGTKNLKGHNLESTGIVTAVSFTGSGANLTNLPAANITGTLPALDGSALTGVGIGSDGNINTSGIITATSFSGSGANLTGLSTPLSFRNLIINGQFDVWQRSTSSNSTTGSGYVSADRWRFEASGATYDTSQQVFAPGQTDVPSYPKYYLRFNVTTANDNTGVTQRIEDVDSVQGQHTLSFWAKGTNPAGGSIQVVFLQDFGSGGSSVVSGVLGNFSLSSSWAKQTFTFTPPSISGKTIGTSSYYKISIRQPSADDTTTAWVIDLANVQLERGSEATTFEQRSFGEELIRCQRYFIKISSGAFIFPQSNVYTSVVFPQEMRDVPTLTITGTGTKSGILARKDGFRAVNSLGPQDHAFTANAEL